MDERYKLVALFVLTLVLGYISYKIIAPFLTFILLGLLLAYLVYPLFEFLKKKMPGTVAAALSMILVILVIILPSIWITSSLITQGRAAYESAQVGGVTLEYLASFIPGVEAADITSFFSANKVAAALPQIITTTGEVLVGALILLLVMYYALKDGKKWYLAAGRLVPIKKEYKKRLQEDIEQMTKALFYGQVLTSVIIGAAIGVIFWIFGIPNPVFWGFVMMILSFLPVLGAPVVYIPAGIILMYQGAIFQGIAVIVLGSVIIFLAEYVIRPKFVSSSASLHPLTVIIGALGGIYVLGFVGFLVGPLILGIFITMLSFDFALEEPLAKPKR